MTSSASPIPILDSISSLARRYDVWLTDIWGVMHNGIQPFPNAVEACQIFRNGGGTVVLISNSPRPSYTTAEQLREVGVADDSYDAIATSGDVTRMLISGYAGQTIYHLGPERDLPIYDGLDVTLGSVQDCAAIVCSGLFNDETETPDDYKDLLAEIYQHGVPMICANPDLIVERGDRLIYCAGSLAQAYAALGGEVVFGGKPHAPIYDLAFGIVNELRGDVIPRHRILAIGDGLHTDIPGAAAANIDSLFIASAVHVPGGKDGLHDSSVLDELLGNGEARPVAAMGQLGW
jgi:HAD superfamily hydrolase (TIGR01459 family)